MSALFVVRMRQRREPRRRAQRLAVIVYGKTGDVHRQGARCGLGGNHDNDGATLDASAERHLATAGQTGAGRIIRHGLGFLSLGGQNNS